MADDEVALLEVAELSEELGQGDIAIAIETVTEQAEAGNYDTESPIDMDDLRMPFYERERELAFTLGLAAGAVLENEYGEDHRLANAEPAEQPDGAGDISDAE